MVVLLNNMRRDQLILEKTVCCTSAHFPERLPPRPPHGNPLWMPLLDLLLAPRVPPLVKPGRLGWRAAGGLKLERAGMGCLAAGPDL